MFARRGACGLDHPESSLEDEGWEGPQVAVTGGVEKLSFITFNSASCKQGPGDCLTNRKRGEPFYWR